MDIVRYLSRINPYRLGKESVPPYNSTKEQRKLARRNMIYGIAEIASPAVLLASTTFIEDKTGIMIPTPVKMGLYATMIGSHAFFLFGRREAKLTYFEMVDALGPAREPL